MTLRCFVARLFIFALVLSPLALAKKRQADTPALIGDVYFSFSMVLRGCDSPFSSCFSIIGGNFYVYSTIPQKQDLVFRVTSDQCSFASGFQNGLLLFGEHSFLTTRTLR
eukprot:TRINITY_DN5237_c0_g1_i1.p1 TRINITY_DN5237_c0_g1~~TRINITY_DN5237_c0_g1_i1.p1  ORF type:complete len:110 (-),score=14.86 TRINITY_DN5237_c0_g1_i1:5-334(-)